MRFSFWILCTEMSDIFILDFFLLLLLSSHDQQIYSTFSIHFSWNSHIDWERTANCNLSRLMYLWDFSHSVDAKLCKFKPVSRPKVTFYKSHNHLIFWWVISCVIYLQLQKKWPIDTLLLLIGISHKFFFIFFPLFE